MSCCCQPKPEQAAIPAEKTSSCCKSGSGESESGTGWGILGILIFLSGLSMTVSLAVNISALEGTTRLLVHGGLAAAGILAFLLGGTDLLRPAWEAICERRIVTEHLFLAGIAAAWGVSVYATITGNGAVFYEVPILLPAIRRFGSLLLGRQRGDIESSIQALFAGIATARIQRNGSWESVPLSAVTVGNRILVRPGETVPADGKIIAGRSFVQTASLTGEPFPVTMEAGDAISSGMISMDGDLEMEVLALPADSALSKITDSTRLLLERPPAFLRSAEDVLKCFFPSVIFVSIGTLFFWAWFAGWQLAISHSLAVVLVACPCAFGMALPLLFRRGLASCLQRGIEPTDAAFMESMSLVKMVAFDKTGTLTIPEMRIAALQCASGIDESTVRSVIAAIHARSNHPVARPFWNWAAEARRMEVVKILTHPGRGIESSIRYKGAPHTVRLGNDSVLSNPIPKWAESQSDKRRVFVEIDGILSGICFLTEELRSNSAATCSRLREGSWDIAVITGDASIPDDLNSVVTETYLSQLPSEKAAIVREREASGHPVLFLGDGLNDATALASATASIVVGESATFAGDCAQARWPRPNFAMLPGLLDEARQLSTRARFILKTALTYNSIGIAIAAAGWLHPVAAAVLMLVSSATVMSLASQPLFGIRKEGSVRSLQPITL